MGKKIAVPVFLSQEGKDYITSHGMELVEIPDMRAETIASQAADVDGIVEMVDPFPNTMADKMPNLKIIARHGVGYDNVDQDYFGRQGIWVTITPHANASTVAETTLAAMLDLSKNYTTVVNKMAAGNWNYAGAHNGVDLAGKTLGIMGFGRIGRMVAQKASALDMKIIAYDPFAKDTGDVQLVDRDELLKTSDFITLHMLVTPETTHGFGAREFSLMKKSAYLINFGRAALVDQEAEQSALNHGEIAGAAVDVYDQEPLPADDPWRTTKNVLLTPHIASNTRECMARMAVDAASECVRVLNGEKPQWPVNQLN
ncbi:MAG: phosphoglycerate dehydrogenase [[Lactobacillus] timonensis]|jgi:D-3-phosphoglycerate dehydrogenase|uniref:phosphoglycerate dehydrogenase n=1 Tax=[Lactobacillus] timonensis TaxID=1970790 RepID=UPI002355DF4C|nr:phosphoglycerate dehydrogenase [[Lactobacillus] timonensis]MCI1926426.1 phosphoglycerate dehydrogenase [[Lactobacillus] timonensis]MCI1957814.1 phosphoglycerate dehydrogenase [[Lactobacillus] timonensis]MCI1970832.1 phosphoglycerate dehydrogenase [[Lactobacillus] timonensis]MCI2006978.1 phosphoglycerate dehydrogenase [[Lactobacillus] timonensis]